MRPHVGSVHVAWDCLCFYENNAKSAADLVDCEASEHHFSVAVTQVSVLLYFPQCQMISVCELWSRHLLRPASRCVMSLLFIHMPAIL